MQAFRIALVAAAAFAIIAPAAAAETVWPNTPKEAKVFVQNMPGDAWSRITAASVSLKFIIGKPMVAVFNPYDEALVSVICDGKWSLVGNNAYLKDKGAPETIPPRTMGFIPTDGFDNYCKHSITGLTESGERHDGVLNVPGNFTDSTAIFFKADK